MTKSTFSSISSVWSEPPGPRGHFETGWALRGRRAGSSILRPMVWGVDRIIIITASSWQWSDYHDNIIMMVTLPLFWAMSQLRYLLIEWFKTPLINKRADKLKSPSWLIDWDNQVSCFFTNLMITDYWSFRPLELMMIHIFDQQIFKKGNDKWVVIFAKRIVIVFINILGIITHTLI